MLFSILKEQKKFNVLDDNHEVEMIKSGIH